MELSDGPPGTEGYEDTVVEVAKKSMIEEGTKAEQEFLEHLNSLKIKVEDGNTRCMVERRGRDVSGKWIYLCYPCAAVCSGETILQTHISGKKHKAKLSVKNVWPLSIFDDHPYVQSEKGVNKEKSGGATEQVLQKMAEEVNIFNKDVSELDQRYNVYRNVRCHIQDSLDAIKAPLIGIEYLIEFPPEEEHHEPSYMCTLCNKQGHPRTIINHLTCFWHRYNLLMRHFSKASTLLAPFKLQNTYREGVSIILNRIAQRIEDKYGRMKPINLEKELYEKEKDRIHQWIYKGKHFTEKDGPTFEEIVDIGLIESLNKPVTVPSRSSVSFRRYENNKKDPSPPVVSAPSKPLFNNYSRPAGRQSRRTDSVMSDGSEGDRPASHRPIRNKPDTYQNRYEPYRDKRRMSPGQTDKAQDKKAPNYAYKVKLAEEQRLSAETAAKKTLAYHEKNPEKHPLYPEEWKKFWNRRYKEIQGEGKDPSKHDFKPEWILYWTARMKELHDEELRVHVSEIYRKMRLSPPPATPDQKPEPAKPAHFEPKRPEPKRRSPELSRRSPEPRRRSPDPRHRSPEPRRRSPEFRRRTPEPRRRTPDHLRRRSPEPRRRSPFPRRRSPEPRRRSPEPRRRSPEPHRRSPPRHPPPYRRPDDRYKIDHRLGFQKRHISPHAMNKPRSRSPHRREGSPLSRRLDALPLRNRSRSPPHVAPSMQTVLVSDDELRADDGRSPWHSDESLGSLPEVRSPPLSRAGSERSRATTIGGGSGIGGGGGGGGPPAARDLGPPENVVATLRLLVALEEYLGSIGPKLVDLLAEAIKMEKDRANSSEELLLRESAVVLLETAKEKLKGAAQAGLVPGAAAAAAARAAVVRTAATLHAADRATAAAKSAQAGPAPVTGLAPVPVSVPVPVPASLSASVSAPARARRRRCRPAVRTRRRRRPGQAKAPAKSSEAAVPVAGVGAVDRAQIAQQMAAALIAQGKTDVSSEELAQLVDAVVGMAEAKKRANRPQPPPPPAPSHPPNPPQPPRPQRGGAAAASASASALQMLQSAYDENDKKVESEHVPDAMDGLSDSDLETLLKNFNELSAEEQHSLIAYLKKLEAREPQRVERLRQYVSAAEASAPANANANAPIDVPGSAIDAAGDAIDAIDDPVLTLESDDDDYTVEEVFQSATLKVKEDQIRQEMEIVKKSLEENKDAPVSSGTPGQSKGEPLLNFSSASDLFALVQASIQSTTAIASSDVIDSNTQPRSFGDVSQTQKAQDEPARPLLPNPTVKQPGLLRTPFGNRSNQNQSYDTNNDWNQKTAENPADNRDQGQMMQDNRSPLLPDNRGSQLQNNRGPHMQDNRGPPMQDNRGPQMQDNRGPPIQDNRGPPMQDSRGPLIQDNRGPPMHDNRGPLIQDNRGPPMQDSRGPLIQDNRGPPMHDNRGPLIQDNRGPLMQGSRGPALQDNRGQPMQDNRAPYIQDNRGPYMQDNRGPPNQDNRAPQMQDNRGPYMQENRGPYMQENRGPPMQENRGPPMQENRGPPMQENRGPPMQENRGPPMQENRGPPMQENRGPPMQDNRGFRQDGSSMMDNRGPPHTQDNRGPQHNDNRGFMQDNRGPYNNMQDNRGMPMQSNNPNNRQFPMQNSGSMPNNTGHNSHMHNNSGQMYNNNNQMQNRLQDNRNPMHDNTGGFMQGNRGPPPRGPANNFGQNNFNQQGGPRNNFQGARMQGNFMPQQEQKNFRGRGGGRGQMRGRGRGGNF